MRPVPSPARRAARSPVVVALAVIALLAGGATVPAVARADAPKPAKKDTRASVQPKQATFTTSVTPAQAKPGDLVTYKVKAKLDEPWHIYKYSKKPGEDGPKLTEFDFFDTAGLTLVKDWTAQPEPTKKREPAFPDIPFLEYHEDEVVWSQQLRVPADAKPGKLALRCQIGYMLCSDQNCTMPGQWTLPPAEVTIVAKGEPSSRRDAPGSRVRLVSLRVDDPPAAGEAKPTKKDSRLPLPKQVKFATAIVPAAAKPGETAQLKITAQLNPEWHIFQYATSYDGVGPKPLLVEAFDLNGLVSKGGWTSDRAPIRKKDPNFPEIEALDEFEGEVTWTLPVEIPAGTAPGAKSVRVQVGFQICSNTQCSIPGQWTLPAATLTVAAADGSTPAAPPAPAAVATSTPPPATAPKIETVAAAAPARDQLGPNTSAASTVDPRQSPIAATSDIQKTAKNEGLVAFLLACGGAGLLALAMPCVWPMIPVTVNFFVKQGEKSGGKATGLAITYCLAIIGIFTGIGVLFAAVLGASSLSNLANNPWLNTAVAVAFFAFGLSLLGLFEIRLPNFLLNASAQGEGRGGLVGVMFMATTLTITSFTCTFPVVGGLLVGASRGEYFYPIIGLATFAAVLALPFFLLSLAPGLLTRLPKSGDWMNTVKVVGGLIELAAAFKFVNTAEIGFHSVPEQAWVDEQTLLTVWVVMAFVCGVYLLGLFRTDHDLKEVKVGPGRMVTGAAFLFLGLYLAPALFGKPPEGMIYNQFVVGLLPPRGSDEKATSTDPEIALTQEKTKHGVVWGMSYAEALKVARSKGKKVLIDFTGVNCASCRQMERTVMVRPDVAAQMGQFVTVQLYTDRVPISSLTQPQREELAEKNIELAIKLTGDATNPIYVIVDPAGGTEQVVAVLGGLVAPERFLAFLAKGTAGAGVESAKVANRQ